MGGLHGKSRAMPAEPGILPYWRFKTPLRKAGQRWDRRLFQYISDQEVTNFLHALRPHLRSARDRTVLEALLECCGNLAPERVAEEASGEATESALKEKYGPGGEGERHRVLKQHIADQPECLGLGGGNAVVEHRFVTGDRVDVSIDLANGEHCVVEIEVEGESTSIGAHQALKYRALRAGQLDSTVLPHACLVAYSIKSVPTTPIRAIFTPSTRPSFSASRKSDSAWLAGTGTGHPALRIGRPEAVLERAGRGARRSD